MFLLMIKVTLVIVNYFRTDVFPDLRSSLPHSSVSTTPFLESATSTAQTSTISGLYEYFTVFQKLYNSYIDVKTKYYEENDRLAIEHSLAFDSDMEQYRTRFMESSPEDDSAAAAYENMPEWIVPKEKLSEACRYMHDDARHCHESSLYSEFHKTLMVMFTIFVSLAFYISSGCIE